MNATGLSLYTVPQVTLVALAAPVVCPLLSAMVYLTARRRLLHRDSLTSQAYLFYLLISGNLLGQFLGHVSSANVPLMALFIALGFFAMHAAQEVGQRWNTNAHFHGVSDYAARDDIGLHKESMTMDAVIVSSDLASPTFAQEHFEVYRQDKDERKRRWMLACLLLLLVVITFTDGLFLIYRASPTAAAPGGALSVVLVICFYINVATMSLCVYGAMLHAKLHIVEDDRRRVGGWCALTALWSVVVFCNTAVMLLAGVTYGWVAGVVAMDVLVALYGVAAGVLLNLAAYFYLYLKRVETVTTKGELATGILVFGVSLGQNVATSYFL
jgi:hypothetical protein